MPSPHGYHFTKPRDALHRPVCFDGITRLAAIACNTFWHVLHGHVAFVWAALHAEGLLHPEVRLRFVSNCSAGMSARIYSALFIHTPEYGVARCDPSTHIIRLPWNDFFPASPGLREIRPYNRSITTKLHWWYGGLLNNCSLIDNDRITGSLLFSLHTAAAGRMQVLPRAARGNVLRVLFNQRSSGRALSNPAHVLREITTFAHERHLSFQHIDSGEMTAAAQLAAFAGADIVVQYHGSANALSLFMPPDSIHVELQPGDGWHCGNAYTPLGFLYILSTTRSAGHAGSCTPLLSAEHPGCGTRVGVPPTAYLEQAHPCTHHTSDPSQLYPRRVPSIRRVSQTRWAAGVADAAGRIARGLR